jgi:hypothetical protein
VAVTVPKNKYELNGFALRKTKGFQVDLSGKYNNPTETIILKTNYEGEAQKNCHIDLEFKMSKYPDTAFSAVYDGNRDDNLVRYQNYLFTALNFMYNVFHSWKTNLRCTTDRT